MAFEFRYEALLSYRGRLKEKAEIELSRARRCLKEATDGLASLENARRLAGDALRKDLARVIPAHVLRVQSEYLDILKHKSLDKVQEVSRWETEVKEKRNALLRITKDFKIMEKLRERDLEKWQLLQNRLEQKRQDEIVILRHQKEAP
jgi:flagellar export protein FliJ